MSTCLDCKELCYSTGGPGYSEVTPGWDASLSCNKNYWVYDAFNDELPRLRAKLYSSRTCPDFKKEDR